MSETISPATPATTITTAELPPLGAAFAGGYYGGQVVIGTDIFAVVWAPKAEGQTRAAWLPTYTAVPGAESRSDSVANTKAMAAAGSPAALFALGLTIAGHNDWVVPARDVLELGYRHFKPTDWENYADGIDGVNPSSLPVGEAYTDEVPVATAIELFADGQSEAFDEAWYWSSTQYSDDNAWSQDFNGGSQSSYSKKYEGSVRAVRLIQLTT